MRREGEKGSDGEREAESRVSTMERNNRAASMEKERWWWWGWWGEGYLDNGAGDRSTMAAVFSIRHYLIDRVAGLIVQGGYFRAAFVRSSAIPPHHPTTAAIPLQHSYSSILNSKHPHSSITSSPSLAEALLSCLCLCMHESIFALRTK